MPPGFWTSIGNLSAPALATVVCALLIWALVTERLVIGKQYRATLARAIEAEKARDSAVAALIEKNVADQASTSLLGTIRREIAATRQDT